MRRRVVSRIVLVGCAIGLAVAIAGCTNSVRLLPDNNEGGWFSKPVDVFAKPSWARATGDDNNVQLNPRGPVAPEELVSADGRCGAPAVVEAPAAPAAAPTPAAAAGRPAGRHHGRRPRQRAHAGRRAGRGQPQCRPARPARRRVHSYGRDRARHDRMRGGAARRSSRQHQYRRRRQRRTQGRAHLPRRHLAGHLHVRRWPAEGRRPRPGAGDSGQAGRKKNKKPRKRRNRRPPPARSSAPTCSDAGG